MPFNIISYTPGFTYSLSISLLLKRLLESAFPRNFEGVQSYRSFSSFVQDSNVFQGLTLRDKKRCLQEISTINGSYLSSNIRGTHQFVYYLFLKMGDLVSISYVSFCISLFVFVTFVFCYVFLQPVLRPLRCSFFYLSGKQREKATIKKLMTPTKESCFFSKFETDL